MNKVLLVFPYKLNEKNIDFQKIIDRFDSEGYDIVNFEGINDDFNIMSLPNYINYVKEQFDYIIDRFSVLSNVREFIFIWFRAYNGLVDDFIYFIDRSFEDDFIKDNNLENEFYRKIRDFSGIDIENINSKIVININYDNYEKIIDYLITEYKSKYFVNVEDFSHKSRKNSKFKNKIYSLRENQFDFTLNPLEESEIIDIKEDTDVELTSEELKKISLENKFLIPYFISELLKVDEEIFSDYINFILKMNFINEDEMIYKVIISLSKSTFDFHEISRVVNLLLDLNFNKEKIFNYVVEIISFKDKIFLVSPNLKELNVFLRILNVFKEKKEFLIIEQLAKNHLKNYNYDKKVIEIYLYSLENLNKKELLLNYVSVLKDIEPDNELANFYIKEYNIILDIKKNKKTFLLIKGQSTYDVTRYGIEDIYKTLNNLGHNAILFDVEYENLNDLFTLILKNKITYIIAHNGKVIKEIKDNLSYFDYITFISIFGDHPIYHYKRLSNKRPKELITFVDKKHVRFAKNVHNIKSFFLSAGYSSLSNRKDDFMNKNNDIIFVGTIKNPKIFRDRWKELKKDKSIIFDEVTNYVLSKEFFLVQEDIDYILNELNIYYDSEEKKELYRYSYLVDQYVRNYRRIKILNSLTKLNLKLYSNCSQKLFKKNNKFTINKGIKFNKIIKEINDSKILLNVLPEFSHGAHERLFNSMVQGTVVMTNTNDFIKKYYRDKESILLYEWVKLDKIKDTLQYYLNNIEELKLISSKGKFITENNFSTKKQVEGLLSLT